MTPAARLAAAIELAQTILTGAPAEATLTNWARGARYAGSKDRAAVRDIVFDCLRKKRSYIYAAGGVESGRALVLSHVRDRGDDPAALFTGEGYGPSELTDHEKTAPEQSAADLRAAPTAVRLDYPDFLHDDLTGALGADLEPVMAAMRERAPVDLRVNLARGTRAEAQAALAQDEIEAVPVAGVETALRITANPRRLAQSTAFGQGLVEPQDASSQFAARLADVKPGQRVLDFCAGGGGKALALYDQGASHGGGGAKIFAHDIAEARMKDLPNRAARAQARVTSIAPGSPALKPANFDTVFVDAPCSGSGAWRRTPDAKWRIEPEHLTRLCAMQREILTKVAPLLRPGGTLIYATCSFLPCENDDQLAWFLAQTGAFSLVETHHMTPLGTGDGFFAAKLERLP